MDQQPSDGLFTARPAEEVPPYGRPYGETDGDVDTLPPEEEDR
ncbi:hypothetical protein ACL02R_05365 [Streptomyces sp. MS19]